ncbi:hypothetical protein CHUAL_005971 [Chamberlinius hualienensis]
MFVWVVLASENDGKKTTNFDSGSVETRSQSGSTSGLNLDELNARAKKQIAKSQEIQISGSATLDDLYDVILKQGTKIDNFGRELSEIKSEMLMLKEEFQATRLVLETKIDLVKKETNVMKVELAKVAVNVTEANMAIKLLRKDLDMEVNYNMRSNLLLDGFDCTNEIDKEIMV